MKGIICGSMDSKISPSWGKTTEVIYNNLKNKVDIIDFIDYSMKNRLIRYLHKRISTFQYGIVGHRDWYENLVNEKNFEKKFAVCKEIPDFFMHISYMTVPQKIEKLAPNFAYFDATIFGGIKYNNEIYSKRYLKHHIYNTKKYADRLKGIFTFNQWTKDSLTKDFGIDSERIFNIGFGANLNPYFEEKDYSNNLILTVLRRGTEKNKGLFLLLDAFEEAKAKNNKLQLAVVGTTNRKIEGVEYYENFPREKTIELFRKASLYAMPALFEPNGMVYPEALSCKTPILGLDRCAFNEFAGNGKFGFIVEPNKNTIAKNILAAFEDTNRLKRMGMEGQKFVLSRYKWDIVIDKMIEIIKY